MESQKTDVVQARPKGKKSERGTMSTNDNDDDEASSPAATAAAAAVACKETVLKATPKKSDGDKQVSSRKRRLPQGPILLPDGRVEFSLGPIQTELLCSLCCGTLKEPYRLIQCLHTFCKSCLWFAQSRSNTNSCPTCNEYLGRETDWTKHALPDRTLQDILDKVLFPELAAEDAAREEAFYGRRNIERKEGFLIKDNNDQKRKATSRGEEIDEENQEQKQGSDAVASASKQSKDGASSDQSTEEPPKKKAATSSTRELQADGTVCFRLVPFKKKAPSLQRSYLETQGKITMGQLKKYLLLKLPALATTSTSVPVPGSSTTAMSSTAENLEILCNGVVLGNELSVNFVLRTLWIDEQDQETLTLEYRRVP